MRAPDPTGCGKVKHVEWAGRSTGLGGSFWWVARRACDVLMADWFMVRWGFDRGWQFDNWHGMQMPEGGGKYTPYTTGHTLDVCVQVSNNFVTGRVL